MTTLTRNRGRRRSAFSPDFDRRLEDEERERPRFIWDAPVDLTGTLFDPTFSAPIQQEASKQRAKQRAVPHLLLTADEIGILSSILANKGTWNLTDAELAAYQSTLDFMAKRGSIEVNGNRITLSKRLKKRLTEADFEGYEGGDYRFKTIHLVSIKED